MATKSPKVRDTGFQWRAELRDVQRENRSLRRVQTAAQELLGAMVGTIQPESVYKRVQALRNAQSKAALAPPTGDAKP